MHKVKISRKEFISRLWGLISIPYILLAYLMGKKNREVAGKREIRLPASFPESVNFYEDVILVKNGSGLQILSARCTHLGCRINKISGNKLVCPCHGSKFDLDGKILEGPAAKNLQTMEFTIDKENDQVVVSI